MSIISSSMHAISLHPDQHPLMQWTVQPMPVPRRDDVLIRVVAAGLNRADILQRKGKYPPPAGASAILGMEVAGTVAAVGADVQRWKIGDRVCALIAGGGYAEYCAAPAAQCLPVPAHLSLQQASILPEAIATVWANVFEAGKLASGETALIHGGSSGIGTMAIQLGKLFGARIFVTAGSDEKCAFCREFGADFAVNYKTEDFAAKILEKIDGQGVDLVLDMIGGDYIARNLSTLAPKGRHVSIATQAGSSATIDMRVIMMKQLILTGSTLRSRSPQEKARLMAEIEAKVWPYVEKNQIKPLIDMVFPIKAVDEAHKRMESSAHIGKIVLEVQAAL